MSAPSFKVFAFDGLRGFGDCSGREQTEAGWFRPEGFEPSKHPDLYQCPPGYQKIGLRCAGPCGGYWCAPAGTLGGLGDASLPVEELTGTLAGGSIVRIIPEIGTRLIWTAPAQAPVVLVVNRQIVVRMVISTPVHGNAAKPDGSPPIATLDTDTTIALREPVHLERDPSTSESEGIYDDLGIDNIVLGAQVQVVLPAKTLVEVLEASPESSDWLGAPAEPEEPPPPTPPRRPINWPVIVGGVMLLGVVGWLLFGGKKTEE